MAKVTVKHIKIPVTTYESRKIFTLELDSDEAQFLIDILAHVSGDQEKSRRRFQRAISDELRKAGVRYDWPSNDIYGSVVLKTS